ncbi:MAG: hypothetical protein J0I80_16300 [Sphingomonas sp.]|nr:hypothetical protein [Sphingomonas sp.]
MSLALLLLAQAAPMLVDGPDLKLVDRAVDKCDRDAMAKVFSAEPQRRRAMVIAVFNEQQAIVAERQALAQRRLDAQTKPAGAPVPAQPAGAVSFDVEAQMLANRQQALDDARMLGNLRDAALDMMRQQYLLSCNSGLAQASGK